MRGWRTWGLVALLGTTFIASVIAMFNRQFASGELYPPFSSMRTDRLGTRLLYTSLGKLPGITVERSFLPMEFLPRDGATLVVLGANPMEVNWNDGMLLEAAEKIAARGNRAILALYIEPDTRNVTQENLDRGEAPDARGARKAPVALVPPLQALWKVRLKLDPDVQDPHRLYFEQAQGWRVRESAGAKILTVERETGKGSIVLMAESAAFTNESAVGMDRMAEVCGAIGPYRRIVFDEQHLGVAESGSVVGMARQFRLTGLILGLGLCAALFIWRNASAFPPPAPPRAPDRFSGRTSHAGLLTLLKRHIPPGELAAVCWREWLSTNRRQATPEMRKRAEEILAGAAGRPVEATRELQTLVGAKGEL